MLFLFFLLRQFGRVILKPVINLSVRVISICKLPTRMLWLSKQHDCMCCFWVQRSNSILLHVGSSRSSTGGIWVLSAAFNLYYTYLLEMFVCVCCNSVWVPEPQQTDLRYYDCPMQMWVNKLPCQIAMFVYMFAWFFSSSFCNSSNECQNV